MTRKRKRPGAGGTAALLLLLALGGRLWLDNRTVVTRTYTVSHPGIPAAFDGARIAVVSDLHGDTALYAPLLRALEAAKPDRIAITGDLMDQESQWEALEPLLTAMLELAPCDYVSGNHEWADLNGVALFRRLSALGVNVLRNRWQAWERNGARIILAGVEDPNGYADGESPARFLTRVKAEAPGFVLTLCHRPGLFPELAASGADVVLSGHHHGGLIRLPLIGGLAAPGELLPEYDKGLFTLGGSTLLLSPGLAGVQWLPRLFNRPEVSLLLLRQG